MKSAAICMTLVCGLPWAGAAAQGTSDPMEKFRNCVPLAHAERLDCLDRLSRDMAPSSSTYPAGSPSSGGTVADAWIVSETTSPLDYTPVAVATAWSAAGPDGTSLQLSIQCRGGRTELVMGGPAVARRNEDLVVSYGVNEAAWAVLGVATPTPGSGAAVKGDVVGLLGSLPDRGHIAFRLTTIRPSAAGEGRYDLARLQAVLDRMARPCRWPPVTRAPRK